MGKKEAKKTARDILTYFQENYPHVGLSMDSRSFEGQIDIVVQIFYDSDEN